MTKHRDPSSLRILYGVVGEGMGHATRSRVIIEHLLASGHEVRVVVSGRAHAFLRDAFAQRERITLHEIHGLTLSYRDNTLRPWASLGRNLRHAPRGVLRNVRVYGQVAVGDFRPQVVISDFESWAYLYGVVHRLPVISIDNMQVIDRCEHGELMQRDESAALLGRWSVKVKLPNAYHYLVTSFFAPPLRKGRTTLVPPILRPEIVAARAEPGEHVLVYQTSPNNRALLQTLAGLPQRFRVYGMGSEGGGGNVELRPFSSEGFVEDLRTARGVIAGGGFSLMSEAVHLGVPMLSLPIAGQFEQELNARYLAALGFGEHARELTPQALRDFLSKADTYRDALARYPSQDNRATLDRVDDLLSAIAAGVRPRGPLAPAPVPALLAA